jgi:hypothetical protein
MFCTYLVIAYLVSLGSWLNLGICSGPVSIASTIWVAVALARSGA